MKKKSAVFAKKFMRPVLEKMYFVFTYNEKENNLKNKKNLCFFLYYLYKNSFELNV